MNDEIGGYIELETPVCKMHQGAIRLNSARNCLAYLIEAKGINKILLPDYLCDSIYTTCEKLNVSIAVYPIDTNFEPLWKKINVEEEEYLYLVDYFGQLSDSCISYAFEVSDSRLIIDEVQALFASPKDGIDTLYSPRKFLGVPDGGFLYTDAQLKRSLQQDKSGSRIVHLVGRLEENASAFYQIRQQNDEALDNEPIKRMSKLTKALLGSIDDQLIINSRVENYRTLAAVLDGYNPLNLTEPSCPFAYPLQVNNGLEIKKQLAKRKIYIPTLWPNVLDNCPKDSVAYQYSANILPIPCDQRYGYGDMEKILDALRDLQVIPNPLKGKRIAILGGTIISCQIIECAKQLGMHTTVIDYNEPSASPGKLIADDNALISVADTGEVVSYIKSHAIDGVITGYSDTLLPMYAEICSQADLPCYGTKEQFELFTDKLKWKALCRECNVPTAKEYTEKILQLPKEQISLPLFVKPADGAGARGTSIVATYEELKPAIEYARDFSRNGQVVIEDYLSGPEVTVFWLFLNGTYKVFLIGNRLVKHNQEGVIPLPAGYTFPASVLPRYMQEVAPCVEKMLHSQGVKNGMMFMQCIVRDGLPFVYDIGYRLTGSLEHLITKSTYGYSPMEMLLRFAVTGEMSDDPLLEAKINKGLVSPSYNISFLMKPGTIDHFEGIDDVLADETVVDCVKAHVEGETLPPEAKGQLRQIALRVLGSAESANDLRESMLNIQSKVHIISKDGEDLLLPGLDPSDFKNNVLVG